MAKEKEKKEEVVIETPGPLDDVKVVTLEKKTEVKKETVEVDRADLQSLMDRLEKQSKDIDLLYRVSDKSRLAREMNDGNEFLVKTVKISMWDNGEIPVVGWTLVSNRCEVILGRWVEEQTANVILENGEVIQVPLLEFYRKILKKVPASLLSTSENTDAYGKKVIIYNVEFPNGKKLSINSSFIN